MAFVPLPKAAHRGRAALTVPHVSCNDKNKQTTFSLPRSILREAGLPDFPGAKLNVLVGEGDDYGCVAIVAGDRARLSTASAVSKSASLRASGICTQRVRAKACPSFIVGNKQLIIRLPADFPWAVQPSPEMAVAA